MRLKAYKELVDSAKLLPDEINSPFFPDWRLSPQKDLEHHIITKAEADKQLYASEFAELWSYIKEITK